MGSLGADVPTAVATAGRVIDDSDEDDVGASLFTQAFLTKTKKTKPKGADGDQRNETTMFYELFKVCGERHTMFIARTQHTHTHTQSTTKNFDDDDGLPLNLDDVLNDIGCSD